MSNISRPHGGKNALHLKNQDKLIDFSVSINPYGPPRWVKTIVNQVKIDQYPDPYCLNFRKVISATHHVHPEQVFVGNGSAEIISLLFTSYFQKGDTAGALTPCFGEFKYYAGILEAKFIELRTKPPIFDFNISDIILSLKSYKPILFYICNPVNPTGKYYSLSQISLIIEQLPHSTFIILDEAYVNFVLNPWHSTILLHKYPNLIILRSLTKDYALTAFRIGYCIADAPIINMLATRAPFWNVNQYAQEAGEKALQDPNFLLQTIPKIRSEKNRLKKIYHQLKLSIIDSETNAYLLKVGDAVSVSKMLLDRNIYVRECSSYGLPEYIRLSVKTPKENNQLLVALKSIIDHVARY